METMHPIAKTTLPKNERKQSCRYFPRTKTVLSKNKNNSEKKNPQQPNSVNQSVS